MEGLIDHTKLTNYTKPILKVLVAGAVIWFLFYRLLEHEFNFGAFEANWVSALLMLVFALLFAVNWFVEAFKWKLVSNHISQNQLSVKSSIKSVFRGVSLGFLTPYRLGEVAGRAIGRKDRKEAVTAFTYTSIAQTTATMIFGLLGISYLFASLIGNSVLVFTSLITLVLGLTVGYMFFPKLAGRLVLWLFRCEINSIDRTVLLQALGLSLFRHVVFTMQFLVLLMILGASFSYLDAYMAISGGYLISSVLPSFSITEIGNRVAAMIIVFQEFIDTLQYVPEVTVLIYLINVGIPALAGVYFLRKS